MTLTRLSWFNKIGLVLILAGVVACLATRQWFAAGAFALAFVGLTWAALAALRGRGSDHMRVDAAQPLDERERLLTTSGFAFVGQFAMLTQIAIVVWQVAVGGPSIAENAVRLFVLGIVLGVGNALAARRA